MTTNDLEILEAFFAAPREGDVVFNTARHAWRSHRRSTKTPSPGTLSFALNVAQRAVAIEHLAQAIIDECGGASKAVSREDETKDAGDNGDPASDRGSR